VLLTGQRRRIDAKLAQGDMSTGARNGAPRCLVGGRDAAHAGHERVSAPGQLRVIDPSALEDDVDHG
jgi:hypothetical protein